MSIDPPVGDWYQLWTGIESPIRVCRAYSIGIESPFAVVNQLSGEMASPFQLVYHCSIGIASPLALVIGEPGRPSGDDGGPGIMNPAMQTMGRSDETLPHPDPPELGDLQSCLRTPRPSPSTPDAIPAAERCLSTRYQAWVTRVIRGRSIRGRSTSGRRPVARDRGTSPLVASSGWSAAEARAVGQGAHEDLQPVGHLPLPPVASLPSSHRPCGPSWTRKQRNASSVLVGLFAADGSFGAQAADPEP